MLYTFNEVAELQKMPLDYKISVAIEWIGKAFDTCENPALAGWNKDYAMSQTTSTEMATEVIWMNYEPPVLQYDMWGGDEA